MWFVYYEIISFVICYITIQISTNAIKNRLQRELKLVKKNISFSEVIFNEIRVIFICLIPILNVYMIFVYLFSYDKIYEKVKSKYEEVK
ncbi:MAG: hypothetical protein ACI4WW_02775 [Candidatus Coprovivens sp.]